MHNETLVLVKKINGKEFLHFVYVMLDYFLKTKGQLNYLQYEKIYYEYLNILQEIKDENLSILNNRLENEKKFMDFLGTEKDNIIYESFEHKYNKINQKIKNLQSDYKLIQDLMSNQINLNN